MFPVEADLAEAVEVELAEAVLVAEAFPVEAVLVAEAFLLKQTWLNQLLIQELQELSPSLQTVSPEELLQFSQTESLQRLSG